MDETILYPSPNWFLSSVLKVSVDGWLVYGGPGKSLVVLEPLPPDIDRVVDSTHGYKAHVMYKSSNDRVTSVDISPEWPERRVFVTGCGDGVVKEWIINQTLNKTSIQGICSHEAHIVENEEIVGVGYSKGTHIISVGNSSVVTVWERNTNITHKYKYFMRHFKATCMSCSPHLALHVAVGTKQGVVFVLNLNGSGKVVYKVRGQDEEIAQVAWCPQYEVIVNYATEEKKSLATQRLEKIRNEPEPAELDVSAEKTLPEDSLNESNIVPEDDMFDIYKDHESIEFGHKKYQPEDIVVKEKFDGTKNDFLAECERLKARILKNKDEEEESIEALVEAMDKAQVDEPTVSKSPEEGAKPLSGVASFLSSGTSKLVPVDRVDQKHTHLLASISKTGYSVRIWSHNGKILSSCSVQVNLKTKSQKSNKVNQTAYGACVHWYKPDTLLIVDGKMTLLECNPLTVDCKNKLQWHVLHSNHRRGIYYVTSNAPCVQSGAPGDESRWSVWTVGQDRFLIKYDMNTNTMSAKFGTCGGFLYDIKPCPYDAGKWSIGVGDGSLRIWDTETTGAEDNKLTLGKVTSYWQNVQGKVLQCAWHPTKENLLAYSTAESRVGLLDVSKSERPTVLLQIALTHGVYCITWGDDMTLFAIGGRELVMYQADKPNQAPVPIQIEIEGQKWQPSAVNYSHHGLTVASNTGGVAIFSGPGGRALAAMFVFTGAIYALEWHPQQTSSSNEESKYKNLLAVTAVDKTNSIVILQYDDREDGKQLSKHTTLVGHWHRVLQAYWNPHRDGQLLSTSQDSTVRVWDAINGVCISVFDGHSGGTLGATFSSLPQLANKVLSGGNDYCLRLWDINDHPLQNYTEPKREPRERIRKKHRKKNKHSEAPGQAADAESADKDDKDYTSEKECDVDHRRRDDTDGADDVTQPDDAEIIGDVLELKLRDGRRYILPQISRQLTKENIENIAVVLHKHLANNKTLNSLLDIAKDAEPVLYGVDFLKLFGSINEVNEVLDMECESHLELKSYKEYMMLMIFRGRIDTVIQFANDNDLLDPFLVSISPCVSFKYWKDVTKLYAAQIDRLSTIYYKDWPIHKTSLDNSENLAYRKAVALLSLHDVKGAVDVLHNAKLFKEAYVLCRCRHMDSIAQHTLAVWAYSMGFCGNLLLGALIYIAMGDITNAATLLRRSRNQDYLNLAAELAKLAGLNTFADYIEEKIKTVPAAVKEQTEELLDELPTKMALLMRDNENQNGASHVGQDVIEELQMGEIKDQNGASHVVQDGIEELLMRNEEQNGASQIVRDVIEKEKQVLSNGKAVLAI